MSLSYLSNYPLRISNLLEFGSEQVSSSNNNQKTILIFDSGVGGLTILEEIKEQLPTCRYLYCLDSAFFPYSEKSEESIIQRTVGICQKLVEQYQVDLVVIACNTASTVALPKLRESLNCPIVGTVPAIKPAAEISQTKHIGLLATKGTIAREYVGKLISDFASDCHVEKIGTTKLVQIAENKMLQKPWTMGEVQIIVEPWKNLLTLDTVICGCTHFPIMKKELAECLPQVKYFVDSGKAIAKRVAQLLEMRTDQIEITDKPADDLLFMTSKASDQVVLNAIEIKYGFKHSLLIEYTSEK